MTAHKPSKHYFRQRQRNRLYEDVIKAIEAAAQESGVRRKDIAERLSISPSQLSRWLSGPSNWGIDTVSDLLFAIDAELDFKVRRFADRAVRNEFYPLGIAIEQGSIIMTQAAVSSTESALDQGVSVQVPNLRRVKTAAKTAPSNG